MQCVSRWMPCVTTFLGLAAVLVSANPPPACADGPAVLARPPNIVLIFADDLGWKDVGFQGGEHQETPSLDRLAREGMVFTAGYATAGNCAPSRACLLSGGYTPRHHVFAVGSTDRGPRQRQRLVPLPNRSGLASDTVTIAEALQAAGYVCGHFGKWHLAGKDGSLPTQQGFGVSFDSFGERPLPEGTETNKAGPPEDPKGVFALTRRACDFMEANRDRPFFCYLAHHAIHTPLQGVPETVRRLREQPGMPRARAMYAACTHALDASVGMLLDRLESLGLAGNTLVVFTSDNGATPQSSQEPLRGAKGSYYEAGIRVPFIVRWPGVTRPGVTSDVPVSNVDLFPTFLAAAGCPLPAETSLDGASLLPLLSGTGDLGREAIFWHFPGYLDRPVPRGRPRDVAAGFRSRPVSVIRKGRWKLHLFHEEWLLDGGREQIDRNHAVELYDLESDIGERHDLASGEPAKRDELLADLLAWLTAVGGRLAEPRSSEGSTAPDGSLHREQGQPRGEPHR
jgi:arylsulfatase A-like enzyme